MKIYSKKVLIVLSFITGKIIGNSVHRLIRAGQYDNKNTYEI